VSNFAGALTKRANKLTGGTLSFAGADLARRSEGDIRRFEFRRRIDQTRQQIDRRHAVIFRRGFDGGRVIVKTLAGTLSFQWRPD
jgi:hypothetical protein